MAHLEMVGECTTADGKSGCSTGRDWDVGVARGRLKGSLAGKALVEAGKVGLPACVDTGWVLFPVLVHFLGIVCVGAGGECVIGGRGDGAGVETGKGATGKGHGTVPEQRAHGGRDCRIGPGGYLRVFG